MLYAYELVVPANTPESAPVSQVMKLTVGVVHKLEVFFPAGNLHLVKVVIMDGLHQVWPTNPDGQLKADNYTISYPVWYELTGEPYELTAYGWSPGTTYNHTITIRLGLDRREILLPGEASAGILQRLGKLIFGGSS